MKKYINSKLATALAVASIALLAGCEDRPSDCVIQNGHLKVYHVEQRKNDGLGKYEYWIRDNSTRGWRLITDQELKEGDELEISKAR